ncbi:NADPH-cytochrome P450 reductase [Cryptococcus amylolentus CBS 6273]|uniref:NADPH-cytochrome P450 reductase n=1 Tax=Cryptococcus amylolentus CBS 6273 TaxID=1296118 RepID=A0A1E3J5X9_9TREE|nr:NADPH-cytochrome P450 reductase [Cryptococcus amylolentus CBS 6273]
MAAKSTYRTSSTTLPLELAPLIIDKRAYIYIWGDAKNMSKAVEEILMEMLGQAKGGSAAVEGAKELKTLKERNVSTTICALYSATSADFSHRD